MSLKLFFGLWVLFFLICLGLGYPTLNRYDPGKLIGIADAGVYQTMVVDGPEAIEGHVRFRVLVPFIVKPIYLFAKGKFGTWNPLSVGFLVANSFFTATTACLLVYVGFVELGDYSIALLSAALFLLNFATANLALAGLIDSSVGCFMMAIVWTLSSGKAPWLLPVWGVLGALSKEVFVPFSIIFGTVWWLASRRTTTRFRDSVLIGIAAMAILEFATIVILQSAFSRKVVLPWAFAADVLDSHSNHKFMSNLLHSAVDQNFWYIFLWLLPLGLLRLRDMPRTWIFACAATTLVAFVLNAYYAGASGTVGRSVFSIAGPMLSLSAAVFLSKPKELIRS